MSIVPRLRRAFSGLTTLLFPPHCASCEADTEVGEHLCGKCERQVRRIEHPHCRRCSQPFDGAIDGEFECSNCGDRKYHFECAVARFLARGVVRDFIHGFKYNGKFHLRHQLVRWLLDAFDDERLRSQPAEALIPVPLHPARQREREFNQAEVLAQMVSKHTGIPILNALRRTRYTTTQTQLDRRTRMENLRGAFELRQTPPVQSRHLLLVDDVLTTGSTLDECARILRNAGAASVRAVTVARG